MMRAAIIAIVLSSASVCSAEDAPPRWVKAKEQPEVWSAVRTILADVLAPDEPAKKGRFVALRYKYVSQVLLAGDSALAIVAMRQGKEYDPSTNIFTAFNVDLSSRTKSEVTDVSYSVWSFWRFARFDRRELPDVVFRHHSCGECEATHLAGSFYFDSADRRWKLRQWPEAGAEIAIGSAPQHFDDEDRYLDCVYAVRDFTKDGYDDFATWCKTIGEAEVVRDEKVTLYTVDRTPQRRVLSGSAADNVKRELCRTRKPAAWCK